MKKELLSRYSCKHLNDYDLWRAYCKAQEQFDEIAKEVEKRSLINKSIGEWSHVSPQDKNYPK